MASSILSENLAKFGFSTYESKAYIAILNKSPVTGYELAKNSGVPPSKIYEVISKLLDKSVLLPVQGDPVKYVPQDINVFLNKIQDDTKASISLLKKELPRAKNGIAHYIWSINSRQELITKASELIATCKKEILLFCWDEEIDDLLPALEKKKKKKIVIIQYGRRPLDFGVVYHHRLMKEKKSEKGGREFTLITDDASLLQGIISEDRTHTGVWTTNPSLVDVAKDFIRHDIYAWKLINRFGPQVEKAFGKDYKKLRDIYSK